MMKRLLIILCLMKATAAPVLAAEVYAAVPRFVIYPRQTITEEMLVDVRLTADGREIGHTTQRRDLIGKVARGTLLPGRLISKSAIEEPRLITLGSQIKIIFRSEQITISAVGTALQNGAVGDSIRVRNLDSGIVVTGQVQAGGFVMIGGS